MAPIPPQIQSQLLLLPANPSSLTDFYQHMRNRWTSLEPVAYQFNEIPSLESTEL